MLVTAWSDSWRPWSGHNPPDRVHNFLTIGGNVLLYNHAVQTMRGESSSETGSSSPDRDTGSFRCAGWRWRPGCICRNRSWPKSGRARERRRTREQARLELLNRLEKIKLQELGGGRSAAEVVFSASLEGGSVRFPWDPVPQTDDVPHTYVDALREAERTEFVLHQPAEAERKYLASRAVAGSPARQAYALLGQARTLDAGGRQTEALGLYRQIFASPATDEYGIPFALYAASRVRDDAGLVLAVLQREAARPCCRPLPAMYLLRDLALKPGTRDLVSTIDSRIHMLERAESLRREMVTLLPRISGPDPGWAAYGDPPWLVGLSSPSSLLAIDAAPVVSSLSGHLPSPQQATRWARAFPGLRLKFPAQINAGSTGSSGRLFLRRSPWWRPWRYWEL